MTIDSPIRPGAALNDPETYRFVEEKILNAKYDLVTRNSWISDRAYNKEGHRQHPGQLPVAGIRLQERTMEESETQANLDAHASGISWWLSHSPHDQITIESPMVDPTHPYVYSRASGTFGPGATVVTVLKRDATMPDGYSIFTLFANP